jgi:hypothetical protein
MAAECKRHVVMLKEEIYQKAMKKLTKLSKAKGDTSKHYHEMVEEYTELAVKFEMLIPFDEAEQRHEECLIRLEESKQDEIKAIYFESLDRLSDLEALERKTSTSATSVEHAKMSKDYEELRAKFLSISDYEDAAEKAEFCSAEMSKFQAYRTAAVYKEASKDVEAVEAREDKETLGEYVHRMMKYKKITNQYKSAGAYDDSEYLARKYRKLHKSYRFKVFKKVAPVIAIVLAVFALAVFVWVWISGNGNLYV